MDAVSGESAAGSVAGLILARADDDHTAILFEDRRWSYREYVAACTERARLLLEIRRAGPFHVGVLLENVPEYPMLLGAAALAGATIVGINPTRRGAELERDVRHAECQMLVTESRQRGLLEGLDLGLPEDRVFDVDSEAWERAVARHRGLPPPDVEIDPAAPCLLLFTSGTTGAPKAASISDMTRGGSDADEERMNRSRQRAITSAAPAARSRIAWCIVGTAEYQVGRNSSSHSMNCGA